MIAPRVVDVHPSPGACYHGVCTGCVEMIGVLELEGGGEGGGKSVTVMSLVGGPSCRVSPAFAVSGLW